MFSHYSNSSKKVEISQLILMLYEIQLWMFHVIWVEMTCTIKFIMLKFQVATEL